MIQLYYTVNVKKPVSRVKLYKQSPAEHQNRLFSLKKGIFIKIQQ